MRLSVHRQLWHPELRSSSFILHRNLHSHSLSQTKPPTSRLLSLPLELPTPSSLHSLFDAPPMAPSLVGVLVPLNKSFQEDDSAPRLPVFEGHNVVGRGNVPANDKRLSRKHITLSASLHDGSALLLVNLVQKLRFLGWKKVKENDFHKTVSNLESWPDDVQEGMNPVVINSGDQKRKLNSGERATIKNGDIVELIPGSFYFKYVTQSDQRTSAMDRKESGGDRECKIIGAGSKRTREELDSGGSAVHSPVQHRLEMKVKEQSPIVRSSENTESKRSTVSTSGNSEETLRHFHIPDDKMPLTFRLLKGQGLPEWANTSCVSIDDVIKGDVLVAILSNYMVDMDWLSSACPALKKVPQVLVVHGEGGGVLEYMKVCVLCPDLWDSNRNKPSNWILHRPPLPISYGTHHSKAMLLVYPRGVRVIVHTANLIFVDWNFKTQGLWMQDFPWKDRNAESTGCEFESDLVDYLQALKLPEVVANLPALGRVKMDASFFKKFNYGNAAVRLIASVPGYHSGPNLIKWGHMKLRSILEDCTFNDEFKNSPLVYQFSSIGSLDEKWMAELKSSMSSGLSPNKKPLGSGEPLIIWPTVEDVRCSLEGYAAGNSIPSPVKNVEKEFLKKYWAKWKASHTGRWYCLGTRSMSHRFLFHCFSKSCVSTLPKALLHIVHKILSAKYLSLGFLCAMSSKHSWLLLTSANLSKAAWGALQKGNSQLMIRSYELGVLFLPTVLKCGSRFSCTDDRTYTKQDEKGSLGNSIRRTKLVTLTWSETESADTGNEIVRLPVPYELPPALYSSQDVPWAWDRKYTKKDVHGEVWPRPVKLYTAQDL
ncbi:hypothetical protein Cgig2_011201 [Carnegiea gigantea]|uniref:Tyrosyl-DNA phosphodiesterase 1 n=1 Tax=Carnegiea gigantea TaxID=171969 RepID=A0A9Q1KG85_9CARY|nr:hypothetical protein Cgig2_011201 [Carnegiea gigantea]